MAEDGLHKYRHFTYAVEQTIRAANREVLNPVVQPLTEDKIVAVAVEVSKRRAAYLKEIMKLADSGEHRPTGEALRRLREEYEETRDAFNELIHTIERGYVDVPDV